MQCYGIINQQHAGCCGSKIPYNKTLPCNAFVRHVIGSSIYVDDEIEDDEDRIAPARILDFKILSGIDRRTMKGHFQWTASGDDLDIGKGQ